MPEQDALLATKLHVPPRQHGFVPRPRLVAELGEGLARGLVVVCAPPGFGKTALLADLARRGDQPVAWLSVDTADNDPARFWRHVVAALDRACPGIAERVRPLLGPPPPSSFGGLVTALINDLAAQPGDGQVVLVLDDYHLVEAPLVHAALTFLLEHLPAGLRLVLTSRSDPPLPLARLRARGQLAELRAVDLRFTPDEAAMLLREATGGDLPTAATALAARTEGWAAGLQLAALSLRGRADPDGFVATFSGSHRYIMDYLTGEVRERQPEQARTFLLETSILERLSGPLCDAVTGRTDSQAMLEQVERAGLFLMPLDEVRGWWRYHHLFADLLRARLHQQQPDRIPALHRSAAAWSEEHGLADDAVRHALGAGDPVWAARLIEQQFDGMFLRGESSTVNRWISGLPAGLARARPRLCLAQAWMALVGGDLDAAAPMVDDAEHAPAGAADEPFEPSAGRAASMLANVPAAIALDRAALAYLRGDAEGTAGFAAQALAKLAEGQWLLDLWIRLARALAEWLRGGLADAERGFAAVAAGWMSAGQRPAAATAWHFLGLVQRAQGRLDAALGTYQQVLEVTAPPGEAAVPGAGTGQVGMAEVVYQRNEVDAARRLVSEGISRCRQVGWTQPLAAGLVTLAWIEQASGSPDRALAAMGEAGRVAPSPSVINLFNPVPVQRARLLLAQGDVSAAARWAEERGLRADDEPAYQNEQEHLLLARVLIAQDRAAQAVTLLERLLAPAAAQDRIGSMIEIQALRALALAAIGDEASAVAALAEALTLACPRGYVRVFADEGMPMSALLGRLVAAQRDEPAVARGVGLGCLAALLRAFGDKNAGKGPGHSAAAAVPGLIEQLTAREVEVLQLLAAGTRNPAIAQELVVSLDTAKKHVSHVLRKLGAVNRTEAVARARELGLIR